MRAASSFQRHRVVVQNGVADVTAPALPSGKLMAVATISRVSRMRLISPPSDAKVAAVGYGTGESSGRAVGRGPDSRASVIRANAACRRVGVREKRRKKAQTVKCAFTIANSAETQRKNLQPSRNALSCVAAHRSLYFSLLSLFLSLNLGVSFAFRGSFLFSSAASSLHS